MNNTNNTTKIKLCGLRRPCDIQYANELCPDYIGFVFAKGTKRYIAPDDALTLRKMLRREITAVGVFVNEDADVVCSLVREGVIDAVQLHGNEDEGYIAKIKNCTGCLVIKAFKINAPADIDRANVSSADMVLLDAGCGCGQTFDHLLLDGVGREYFLAGGLDAENVGEAVEKFKPYAVDVSSAIETDGFKDKAKMQAFVNAVRYSNERMNFDD